MTKSYFKSYREYCKTQTYIIQFIYNESYG